MLDKALHEEHLWEQFDADTIDGPQSKKVDVFLGRMQPLHIGHKKIIEMMKNPVILLVKGKKSSQDKDRNPFDERYQMELIRKVAPKAIVMVVPTGFLPDAFQILRNKGMEPRTVLAGDDRIRGYEAQIKRANNKLPESKEFDVRIRKTPRVTSATKVRNAIKQGDYKTFEKLVPKELHREWTKMREVIAGKAAIRESFIPSFMSFLKEQEGIDVKKLIDPEGEALHEDSGGPSGSIEVMSTDPTSAYRLAVNALGDEIDEKIPKFEKNYKKLKDVIQRYSLGKRREEMPVIKQKDIKDFKKRLEKGKLDINAPYAMHLKHMIDLEDLERMLNNKEAVEAWLTLGRQDGKKKDDKIKVKMKKTKAGKLRPIQTQIYFDKIVLKDFVKFGIPDEGNRILKRVLIVSKEGYIIDGHHRWGAVMMVDPNLEMLTMRVDLNIDELLQIAGDYGDAVGNPRNI